MLDTVTPKDIYLKLNNYKYFRLVFYKFEATNFDCFKLKYESFFIEIRKEDLKNEKIYLQKL